MDRNELKIHLASLDLASPGIIKLLELLNNGATEREISFKRDGIYLHLVKANMEFLWDPTDPNTAVSCLVVAGEYEPIESLILRKFARESSFIVDVGANIGYYTVLLGRELKAGNTLVAFEPFPNSYKQLTQNNVLNPSKANIILENLALGTSEEEFDLNIPASSGSSAASRQVQHPSEYNLAVTVKQTYLDNYLFRNFPDEEIDLIKVDVEGGELDVINGAWQTIVRHRPVLFLELLRKWSKTFGYHPEDVRRKLSELEYLCFGVGLEMNEINEIDDNTVETNFVFVQKHQFGLITEIRQYMHPKK